MEKSLWSVVEALIAAGKTVEIYRQTPPFGEPAYVIRTRWKLGGQSHGAEVCVPLRRIGDLDSAEELLVAELLKMDAMLRPDGSESTA